MLLFADSFIAYTPRAQNGMSNSLHVQYICFHSYMAESRGVLAYWLIVSDTPAALCGRGSIRNTRRQGLPKCAVAASRSSQHRGKRDTTSDLPTNPRHRLLPQRCRSSPERSRTSSSSCVCSTPTYVCPETTGPREVEFEMRWRNIDGMGNAWRWNGQWTSDSMLMHTPQVDGKQKVMFALTQIKGVGRRYSNLVCKKADVDLNKRYGTSESNMFARHRNEY